MRWPDLDLDAPTWAIPGQYRKGGRLHVVPLSPVAVRVVDALPCIGPRVFDGISELNAERDWWGGGGARWRWARTISVSTIFEERVHRMREGRCGAWIISRLSGHATTEGTVAVTGIYNRYTGLPEMASVLAAWAAHVERIVSGEGTTAKVLPMRKGRR